MAPSEQTNNYACHRLIDEKDKIHAHSIIHVDKSQGVVIGHEPFPKEELPFTQWLGGTVILLSKAQLPLLSNAHTLSEYIDNIEANTSIPIGDAPLYAWHTPLIDIHSPLSSPPQPLK